MSLPRRAREGVIYPFGGFDRRKSPGEARMSQPPTPYNPPPSTGLLRVSYSANVYSRAESLHAKLQPVMGRVNLHLRGLRWSLPRAIVSRKVQCRISRRVSRDIKFLNQLPSPAISCLISLSGKKVRLAREISLTSCYVKKERGSHRALYPHVMFSSSLSLLLFITHHI